MGMDHTGSIKEEKTLEEQSWATLFLYTDGLKVSFLLGDKIEHEMTLYINTKGY